MTNMEWLLLVKGPLFNIALFVFMAGSVVRLAEILMLGRHKDYSEAREYSATASGMHAVFSRFLPTSATFKRAPLIIIMGLTFHIGLFVTIFLFIPHIETLSNIFGISWLGLPTPIIDAITVISIISLFVILAYRMTQRVLRFISGKEDYLVWLLTVLPLLTGYLAFHHLLLPYQLMLALHIFSVELLLMAFPFTKLSHAFTLFLARWYSGVAMGRKGVSL